MHRMSFLYDPVDLLCDRIPTIYKKCTEFSIIRTRNGQEADVFTYLHGQVSRKLESQRLLADLTPYLEGKRKTDWLNEDENPLRPLLQSSIQLELNRELDRNILVMQLPIEPQHGKAVLIMHTDSFISQFAIVRENRKLSSAERMLVAALIYQFIESVLELYERDRQLFGPVSRLKSHLQSEIQVMQKELERKDRNLAKGLTEFADHVLKYLSEQYGMEFRLTKRAYDKIGTFDGKFNDLEQSIAQSISICVNSSMHQQGELILDESDLFLQTGESSVQTGSVDPMPVVGRLTKTHQLLDKYEDAARQAQRNGEQVIGRTLGKYCDPPISNAAITDSLNKHAERVWELMKKYPGKWPVIRTHFKSVINLIGRYEDQDLHVNRNSA